VFLIRWTKITKNGVDAMESKNVQTSRNAHDCWNRRDFEGLMRNVGDKVVYKDHPRNLTLQGKQQFKEWLVGWTKAFPDARITKADYIDAGNVVIAQFTVEGTNDGPLPGFPATKKRATSEYCEICRFDGEGRMISGEAYYDQYSMLVQLGHVQPLPAAA